MAQAQAARPRAARPRGPSRPASPIQPTLLLLQLILHSSPLRTSSASGSSAAAATPRPRCSLGSERLRYTGWDMFSPTPLPRKFLRGRRAGGQGARRQGGAPPQGSSAALGGALPGTRPAASALQQATAPQPAHARRHPLDVVVEARVRRAGGRLAAAGVHELHAQRAGRLALAARAHLAEAQAVAVVVVQQHVPVGQVQLLHQHARAARALVAVQLPQPARHVVLRAGGAGGCGRARACGRARVAGKQYGARRSRRWLEAAGRRAGARLALAAQPPPHLQHALHVLDQLVHQLVQREELVRVGAQHGAARVLVAAAVDAAVQRLQQQLHELGVQLLRLRLGLRLRQLRLRFAGGGGWWAGGGGWAGWAVRCRRQCSGRASAEARQGSAAGQVGGRRRTSCLAGCKLWKVVCLNWGLNFSTHTRRAACKQQHSARQPGPGAARAPSSSRPPAAASGRRGRCSAQRAAPHLHALVQVAVVAQEVVDVVVAVQQAARAQVDQVVAVQREGRQRAALLKAPATARPAGGASAQPSLRCTGLRAAPKAGATRKGRRDALQPRPRTWCPPRCCCPRRRPSSPRPPPSAQPPRPPAAR